ncbi:RIIa domain-containing protein 1 isoform X1 [Gasterosteus aculeatus]
MAGSGGSGNPEVGGLSAEQQEKLQHFKVQLRNDNERYLKSHPELDVMVGDFLGNVLLKRPTDIHEFAAGYGHQYERYERQRLLLQPESSSGYCLQNERKHGMKQSQQQHKGEAFVKK